MPVSLHVAAPESSTTPNSLHVRDPESSTVPDSFHVRDPESSTVPDSFHRNHSRGAKSAPWRISQCPGKHNGFVSWEYAQHHLPHHLKKPPQPPIRSTPRFGMEGKRHCGGFHGTKRGLWRIPWNETGTVEDSTPGVNCTLKSGLTRQDVLKGRLMPRNRLQAGRMGGAQRAYEKSPDRAI